MCEKGVLHVLGFPWHKRKALRVCLPGYEFCFLKRLEEVPDNGVLVVWGRGPDVLDERKGLNVWRVEDGFVRSVGLGAAFARPVSWVVDKKGIYFDSSRPSDLEWLLSECEFDDELLSRAAAMRQIIVDRGLTKYNLSEGGWRRPASAARVVLVPGQVESDASIRYGAPGVSTNIELLRAVRESNPGSYVVYKPHPDVVSGLRLEGQRENEASMYCDEVVEKSDMAQLLSLVDEVHCMTSLAGFEALLRGRKVVCYGQPFYSGWGLTDDKIPVSRRGRRLTLDELVAASIVLYPLYMDLQGRKLVSPEVALEQLLKWRRRQERGGKLVERVFVSVLRRVVSKY